MKKKTKKSTKRKQKIDVVIESLVHLEQRMKELITKVESLYTQRYYHPQDAEKKILGGKYTNPLQGHQNAVDINRALEAEKQFHNSIDDHWYAKYLRGEPVEYHGSISDLEKVIDSYKSSSFVPYSIYDESDDSVTAHFKNGEYVSILLNDNITVFKNFYDGAIIGCIINNLKKDKHETH